MISRESLIRQYKLTTIERILALILLFVGVGMLIMIETNKSFASKASVINSPGFFPRIVSIGFMIMSVVLFLSTFDKKRTDTVTINWFGILIVLVWVLFGVLCKPIGFIIAGTISLFITLILFGVRKKLTLILVSIIAPASVYLILGVLMGVRLPTLFL